MTDLLVHFSVKVAPPPERPVTLPPVLAGGFTAIVAELPQIALGAGIQMVPHPPHQPHGAPGYVVSAPPAALPAMVARLYASASPQLSETAFLADPNVRQALSDARTAQQNGAQTVSVFLPHPQTLDVDFQRPGAGNARAPQEAPTQRPSIETPQASGVSVKTPERDDRAGREQTLKATLKEPLPSVLQSERAVKLPPAAGAALKQDHGFYLQVRGELGRSFERDAQTIAAPRQPDQCTKLDHATGELVARPTTQREMTFQRALFVSLLVADTPRAQATLLMQQAFGARLGFDEVMLQMLAQAYGKAEAPLNKQPVDKQIPDKPPQQLEQAQQKTKPGRLPEEMIVDHSRPSAATKHGPKGKERRVEGVGRDRGGNSQQQQQEQPEQESEPQGDE